MGHGGIFITYQEESPDALSQIIEVREVPEPDTDFRDNKYNRNAERYISKIFNYEREKINIYFIHGLGLEFGVG